MEFLKENLIALISLFVAIVGPIVYFLISLSIKVAKLEVRIEMLFSIFPELREAKELLKKFEKPKTPEDKERTVLEILKTLNTALAEDRRRIASKALETTNITPEAIDARIENGIKKEFSARDKLVAALVGQELNEADKQSGKLIGNPIDYMRLGEIEYSGGNYEPAIKYYDKALKLRKDYVWAWVNKCYALRKLGQYEKALESVNEAIKLKPNSAWIWDIKVYVLRELGRNEEADKSLEKASKLRGQK